MKIQIAAAENRVEKVVNQFGKKKTFHNGGFRVGFVVDGQKFIGINKQATYAGEAESWGLLRAVEYAIAQGAKSLTVETNGHCTSPKRKSGFFVKLAFAKAEVAGMELEVSSEHDDNAAKSVARDTTVDWLPRVPEEAEDFKAAVNKIMAADRSEQMEQARRKEAAARVPAPLEAPKTVEVPEALKD